MAESVRDITRQYVPIGYLVSMIAMAGSGFYWLADLNGRVNGLASTMVRVAAQAEASNKVIEINSNRLTRLEIQFEGIRDDIAELTDLTRKHIEAEWPPRKVP